MYTINCKNIKFLLLVGLSFLVCSISDASESGKEINVCAIPQTYDYLEHVKNNYKENPLNIHYASASMIYASVVNKELKCDIYIGNDEKFPIRYISSDLGDINNYGSFAQTPLALFSVTSIVDRGCEILSKGTYTKLVIPNPKYNVSGFWAQKILDSYIKEDNKLKDKIIYNDNEYAVLGGVVNGYVTMGILPYNIIVNNKFKKSGSFCIFNSKLHEPIYYYYMMFKNTSDYDATLKFKNYLLSDESKTILKKHGYK